MGRYTRPRISTERTLDGYDVARAVRADPVLAEVRLIAVTGWGAERDRQMTRDAGFDHHLTKPVDPVQLEAFLRGLKERSGDAEPARL